MSFWLIILLLTLATCALAFYPLLKKSVTLPANQRDSLNKAFYLARLKEVEKEAETGMIDDPTQSQLELQQSLLDDIPAQPQPVGRTSHSVGKIWFVTLLFVVGGISLATYFKVGSWFTGSMLTASHTKLDYFYDRIKNEQNNPLTEQELNQFAMALRVELQQKPNDAPTWFMLGQVGMATDNGQLAMDSFAKANGLDPNNVQYKLSYAQILMFSDDATDKTKGEQLLKEVIRIDHTNTDALSLLAFRAFEQEDYKMAAMTWGMMLRLLPKDDPRVPTIERSIASAQAMLKDVSPAKPADTMQKGEQK